MTIIAYKGEKIKGRDGKVIATVAEDIHSGDVNIRPGQFTMIDAAQARGGYVSEEIMEFVRDRLSSPPEQRTESEPALAKAKTTAKPAKRGRK